jgi:hypothetical protein
LRFSLSVRDGVEAGGGNRVVFDLEREEAHFGAAAVDGPALVWEFGGDGAGALLSRDVDLDPAVEWLMRCDRVDFPAGGIAYRHTHPGPGIRYVLFGSIAIDPHGRSYGAAEAWFEGIGDAIEATASDEGPAAFVRVFVLPREWEGKRTIRYLDPADDEKPRLQRATIYLEHPIDL